MDISKIDINEKIRIVLNISDEVLEKSKDPVLLKALAIVIAYLQVERVKQTIAEELEDSIKKAEHLAKLYKEDIEQEVQSRSVQDESGMAGEK